MSSDEPYICEVDSDEEADCSNHPASVLKQPLKQPAPGEKWNDPTKSDTRPWEQKDFDGQVRELRELAWKVQGRFHKPQAVLDPEYKSQAYGQCSRVVQYCLDTKYVGPDDFKERAPGMRKGLQQLAAELDKKEEAHKAHIKTQTLRPDGSGGYSIGYKASKVPDSSARMASATAKSAGGNVGGSDATTPGRDSADQNVEQLLQKSSGCSGMTTPGIRQRIKGANLVLRNVGLGDDDVAAVLDACREGDIAYLIRRWPVFTDMKNIRIPPDSCYLEELDVSHNQIGDVGIQSLVAFVATGNLPNLQRLVLNNNPLGELGRCVLGGLRVVRKALEVVTAEEEALPAPESVDDIAVEEQKVPQEVLRELPQEVPEVPQELPQELPAQVVSVDDLD